MIGILSDTHDQVDATAAAMQTLRAGGAQQYIHCGDVGGHAVLDHLAGVSAALVWGNNDWDRRDLERYAARLGIECYGSMADLEFGGKKFAVMHGDDLRLRQSILEAQQYDYLLQGHTHLRHDERVGRTRIINPGALHRARPKTVALLETETDRLEFKIINLREK